jgi:hypothetical protein
VGSLVPDPNSLWKIKFDKELATYTNFSIKLQHNKSSKFLGILHSGYRYYKSPSNNHTEGNELKFICFILFLKSKVMFIIILVSCNNDSNASNWDENWKFKHSKLEKYQGYLKSNDIINLSIEKTHDDNKVEFLRSDDQEVVCHGESLGEDDEVSKLSLFNSFLMI